MSSPSTCATCSFETYHEYDPTKDVHTLRIDGLRYYLDFNGRPRAHYLSNGNLDEIVLRFCHEYVFDCHSEADASLSDSMPNSDEEYEGRCRKHCGRLYCYVRVFGIPSASVNTSTHTSTHAPTHMSTHAPTHMTSANVNNINTSHQPMIEKASLVLPRLEIVCLDDYDIYCGSDHGGMDWFSSTTNPDVPSSGFDTPNQTFSFVPQLSSDDAETEFDNLVSDLSKGTGPLDDFGYVLDGDQIYSIRKGPLFDQRHEISESEYPVVVGSPRCIEFDPETHTHFPESKTTMAAFLQGCSPDYLDGWRGKCLCGHAHPNFPIGEGAQENDGHKKITDHEYEYHDVDSASDDEEENKFDGFRSVICEDNHVFGYCWSNPKKTTLIQWSNSQNS